MQHQHVQTVRTQRQGFTVRKGTFGGGHSHKTELLVVKRLQKA